MENATADRSGQTERCREPWRLPNGAVSGPWVCGRTVRFNRRRPNGLPSGPTRSAARLQSMVMRYHLISNANLESRMLTSSERMSNELWPIRRKRNTIIHTDHYFAIIEDERFNPMLHLPIGSINNSERMFVGQVCLWYDDVVQ
jgi:hypothetical protein